MTHPLDPTQHSSTYAQTGNSSENPAPTPATPVNPTLPNAQDSRQHHLMKTAAKLLGIHSLNDLWPVILNATQVIIEVQRAAIFLYHHETGAVTCPAAEELSPTYLDTICRFIEQVPGYQLLQNQQPIIIQNVHTDPTVQTMRPIMLAEGIQAYAILPMVSADNQIIGAIVGYRAEIRPFTPDELAAAQTLAHMCAMAIQSVNLLYETRYGLLREQQLNRISNILNSAPDLPTILSSVIHLTVDILSVEAGLLGLVIDEQTMTFYPYNIPKHIVLRPAPYPRGIAWQTVIESQTQLINDYPNHPLALSKWVECGVTVLLSVPIISGDIILGSLNLFNLNHTNKQFANREIALAESIGRQAGTAIHNVRMLAEANQRTTALRHALTRQAELDELKNRFVQNVSHELRTPLGIIYGHAELLTSGAFGAVTAEQQQSLDIIARRVQMLLNLVNDLTALLAAETQELRREEIDPMLLAYSMLDEYRIQANQSNITLEADIAEKLPIVMGDITHLRRVFDNLVSNAFKFTPEGGNVKLRVYGEAETVIIEVIDNGPGIAEEKLPRVFERFYQIDSGMARRHPGTGLGLALVKEIVEAHRGQVSVSSTVGQGSTFRIMLPGYFASES